MIEEKIKVNEELIAGLNGKIKQGEPNYFPFMAAVNALDINNEMMKSFVATNAKEVTKGESIIRLYALLQGLFVCIDSLYSLNLILTKNKNYININQNRQLRELKYIRNDVVGHPANRVFEDDRAGCCVLKKDLVTNTSFKYYIYYNKEIKAREIKIMDLLDSYYEEANKVLKRIMSVTLSSNEEIIAQIKKIYKKLNSDLEIQEDILDLRSLYLQKNRDMSKKDLRFIWRIELLMKLRKVDNGDKEINEMYDYCSGYQLSKIYEVAISPLSQEKPTLDNTKKVPKGVIQFGKLIEKRPKLEGSAIFLHDMTHPLFQASFRNCMDAAKEDDLASAVKYLELIKSFVELNDSDMVYCLGIVLRNRKK